MDYKLMQIGRIEEEIILNFGILESAIIRTWHTDYFVYVESNYMIYKKRIKDFNQNKNNISLRKSILYYS